MKSAPAGLLLASFFVAFAAPALAAACGSSGAGFPAWLEAYKRQAVASGISPGVVASAFAGVTYDSKVIYLDRDRPPAPDIAAVQAMVASGGFRGLLPAGLLPSAPV
jgi:membrane-bound lytic murein transglycosylase B